MQVNVGLQRFVEELVAVEPSADENCQVRS